MKTTIPPRPLGGALLASALAMSAVVGCNTCYHCPQPCPYGYDTSVPLYDRIVFGWLPDGLTLRSDHEYPEAAPVYYRVPPRPAEITPAAESYAPEPYAPAPAGPLEAEPMPAPELPAY